MKLNNPKLIESGQSVFIAKDHKDVIKSKYSRLGHGKVMYRPYHKLKSVYILTTSVR